MSDMETTFDAPKRRKRRRPAADPAAELNQEIESAEADEESVLYAAEEQVNQNNPAVDLNYDEVEPTRRPRTRIQREMVEEGDQTLRAWVDSLGSHDDFKFKIERRQPKKFKTSKGVIAIDGHLETHDEFIDEDEIRDLYGGGTYTVMLMRRNDLGRYEYFKSRTVKIPGPPNVEDFDDSPKGGESEGTVAQAMATMKSLIDTQQRAGRGDSQEMLAMMQAMMAPVMAQLQASQDATRELQKRVSEKDMQLMQILAEKGKGDPATQGLIDKMWSQESGRLESLRAQHESELRMMRENSREDLKRTEENHQRTVARLEDSHKREIDNLNRSFAGQIEAYKTSYETRIDGLKSEIDRLNRDLAEKSAEVAELRSRKEKSLADQAMELASVQEQLNNVFGGGRDGDDEPKPWYEKIANVVMENPDAIKQLVGPVQAAPPQQQRALPDPNLPPPGQPFQIPGQDGIFMRDEAGNTRQLTQPEIDKLRKQHEAQAKAAEQAARAPKPQEVKVAVMFIEAAIKNGTPPETFAESARSAIPADILRYLEVEGVDTFLSDVANLSTDSPLRTQAGRNYIRKVAKYLLEGASE